MGRPRSDTIIRRFLAGDQLSDLIYWVEENSGEQEHEARSYVESCIRRALKKARAR